MKTIKYFSCGMAVLLTVTFTGRALPLQKGLVPNDAKWLLHVDLDNLRDSKLGTVIFNEVLAGKLAELKEQFKVDGQLILQKMHSVTAFGTDFQTGAKANGVLLFSAEEETQKIVEGLLAAQMLQGPEGVLKKLQQEPFALYSVTDQIFIAPRLGGYVVVSKSREQIEAVRGSLTGKAKPGAGDPFAGYAVVPNSFFFLAVAEGFNESAVIPPQAKILKMADGARVVLGEKADLLCLNLALKAKDAEIIQQIGQVLEGMKALVALGQSENKELLDIVQSTKVSNTEKVVTVNIEYPIAKVIGKLDGLSKHLQQSSGDSSRAKRKSHKSDQPEVEDPKQ